MENFEKYFKKPSCMKRLISVLIFFLIPPSLLAGSIKEVSHNVERVKAVKSPLDFAVIGDSRDGDKVYTQLMQRIL